MLALVFMLMLPLATGLRQIASLDFGWRVSPADPAACDYSVALVNASCAPSWSKTSYGSSCWPAPGNASMSESACAAAACAAGVSVYSYCAGGTGSQCGAAACNIGPPSKLSLGLEFGWVTQMRDTRLAPNPSSPQAQVDFDDSRWAVVDLPHDASANASSTQDANPGEGFLHPVQTWYRKHFRIPADWEGTAITLDIEGGAATAYSLWVNGAQLVPFSSAGYLPIVLRLDSAPGVSLQYGGADNILAFRTDNSASTGWWNEGAGLVRKGARLISAPASAFIMPYGVAAPAYVEVGLHARAPVLSAWLTHTCARHTVLVCSLLLMRRDTYCRVRFTRVLRLLMARGLTLL
jgi:hypothetical protein